MGKATRWLKSLLGMKRHKDKTDDVSPQTHPKEKKRWSFGAKSTKPPGSAANPKAPATLSTSDSAWLRSYLAETETERSKHAIAVAAATAAAADAAVAAAHAAVAVVRLTSQGSVRLSGKRERWAAAKIQAVFRGFLARKALRALKGLVKIQALVRGYLVRKRAAATLHSMQALIRAQTTVRSQRARRSFNKENRSVPDPHHPRKSMESELVHSKRLSITTTHEAGFDESPKIVEVDTCKPKSKSRRFATTLSEYSEDTTTTTTTTTPPYYHYHHNQTVSSPFPEYPNTKDFEWYFNGHECRLPTAHNTPRLGSWAHAGPATPAKSLCGGEAVFGSAASQCSESPSYMANTQSFSAKLRSHSAPKQRPEPTTKKRLSLNEILAARNSISSVRMHKSYTQFQREDFQN